MPVGKCIQENASYNDLIAALKSESITLIAIQQAQSVGLFKIIQKEISDFDVRQTHASVEELQNNHFTIPDTNLEVGDEKTWEWILSQDTKDLKNWLN